MMITKTEWTAMAEGDRAAIKARHKHARQALRGSGPAPSPSRYDLLAWAFLRGWGFRRVERRHRFQRNGGRLADECGATLHDGGLPYEHNIPSTMLLARAIERLVPGEPAPNPQELRAWLSEPCPDLPALLEADRRLATPRLAPAAE